MNEPTQVPTAQRTNGTIHYHSYITFSEDHQFWYQNQHQKMKDNIRIGKLRFKISTEA